MVCSLVLLHLVQERRIDHPIYPPNVPVAIIIVTQLKIGLISDCFKYVILAVKSIDHQPSFPWSSARLVSIILGISYHHISVLVVFVLYFSSFSWEVSHASQYFWIWINRKSETFVFDLLYLGFLRFCLQFGRHRKLRLLLEWSEFQRQKFWLLIFFLRILFLWAHHFGFRKIREFKQLLFLWDLIYTGNCWNKLYTGISF